MWIPRTEAEITQALNASTLSETATFDGKQELGTNSKSIATDIAAMATDGGVILYGVKEDAQKRLTLPNPFPLKGMRERLDQIIQTCIAPPPRVEIIDIPTAVDPT